MNASSHGDVIRREFTIQADAYAATASLADPARVQLLIDAVKPAPDARALEVACGPGHVALVMAPHVGEMVGIDLTDAPLVIAETRRRERGIANLRFETGDATALRFPDGSFEIAVCRFAFHHFDEPERVLAEMVRIVRPGGTVAVHDLIVSEIAERGAYQNRFENLRDRSHTRAFPLSGLLALFAAANLDVEHVSTEALTPQVEPWMERAQTPPDRAAEARALIEADERDDLSGTRPYRVDGQLHFTQRTVIVVGRKFN